MNDDSIEPFITDPEPKSAGCYPLLLTAEVGATGIILRLAGSTTEIPTEYAFWTGDCTQVSITVRFETTDGVVVVGTGTTAVVHSDTDGDCSITFQRSSPDLFDVEVKIVAGSTPKTPTGLAPKPGVPSRKVKLAPKIGYPPPDSGDE
jgi:hypothetical protein